MPKNQFVRTLSGDTRGLNVKLARAYLAPAHIAGKPGWLRTIRNALGLSMRELSERLEVSRAAITWYETAEAEGAITLKTLARVAEKLECQVVLAIVPMEHESFADMAAERDEEFTLLRERVRSHTLTERQYQIRVNAKYGSTPTAPTERRVAPTQFS